MKPSQLASQLRRIASKIDNSKQPDRSLVAQDLKKVLATVSANGMTFDKDGVSCFAECDYDWKNADSTDASGSVTFKVQDEHDYPEEVADDNAVIDLINDENFQWKLQKEFGNKYVTLVPETINGQKVHGFLPEAIIEYLKNNPGFRVFYIEGSME